MIVCESLFCICVHADTDCAASGAAAAAHGCRQALGESMVYPAGDESRRHLATAEPPNTQSTVRSPPSLAKQAGLIPTIRGCSVKTSSMALRQDHPVSSEGPGRERGPDISIMPLSSELVSGWTDRLSTGAH